MHQMGASYAAIAQTQIAADAAKQTLDLVVDAYSRGAATIIDVIDAQNNSLVADETAVEAVFRFMIDLMEAQRSVGILVLHMSESDKDNFFDALDQYMAQAQNGN
jgi:outer membrane protein TolC